MSAVEKLWVVVQRTVAYNKIVLSRVETSSLLAGSFFGSLSMVVINLLLTIHVYRETGSSPAAISVLFVITFLPNLVIAPLFSGLADRWNRRLLLGFCGLIRSLLCVLFLAQWALPMLLILSFFVTSVSAISKPARYALVGQITTGSEGVAVNSLLMIAATTAGIAGGGLSAFLAHTGGREVFALMAVISAFGGILDTVRFRQAPAPVSPQIGISRKNNDSDASRISSASETNEKLTTKMRLINGWRFVYHNPALLALAISTTLLWFGLGVQEPLLLVFVDRVLAAPDSTYPLLSTIGSIGGLIGAITATPLAQNLLAAARSFAISLVFAGGIFCIFAMSNGSSTIAFVTFFLFNVSYGVSNVIDEYLEQELSPDHLRATIISAIGAIGTFGYLLGGSLAGFMASRLGAASTAAGVGLVIAIAGVFAVFKLKIKEEEA